jgi:hypothetical protein
MPTIEGDLTSQSTGQPYRAAGYFVVSGLEQLSFLLR